MIQEMMALEALFEQGRARCYAIRKELESRSTSASSGVEKELASKKAVMKALQKRRNQFYKRGGNT